MDWPILRYSLIASFMLLLLMSVLLPSDGGHGFLSPKGLGFVGSSVSFFMFLLLRGRLSWDSFQVLTLFVLYISALIFFMLWGNLTSREHLAFDQFKLFMITGMVVLMGAILYLEGIMSWPLIFKTIFWGSFTYCAIKCVFAVLLMLNMASLSKVMDMTGFKMMTMGIVGAWQRLQTSLDLSTPFILYFALQSEKLGVSLPKKIRAAYVPLACLSSILSFSRLFMGVAFLAVFLYTLTSGFRTFQKVAISLLIGLIALMMTAGPDALLQAVEKRFFSSENQESDKIREDQIEAFSPVINNNPLLGLGLGSFAPSYIRDEDIKHSYEVQWIAFLGQMGVLGILLMSCFLLSLIIPFLYPPLTIFKITFLLIFASWILAGFTNPFLISLSSGMIYLLFLLAGWQLHDRRA